MLNQTLNIDNSKKYPISISFPKGLGVVSIERPLSNTKSGSYIMEIWKDIKDYKGLYQINNFSRVKSLPRNTTNGGILKTAKNSSGYLMISLCKNGKKKHVYIHRIIAKTFIPNPKNKPCINHKNGIKTDNRLENLEWVTYQENAIHSYKNGLQKIQRGSDRGRVAKLNEKKVKEIRRLYVIKNYSQRQIALKYSLSQSNISHIINYKTWKRKIIN